MNTKRITADNKIHTRPPLDLLTGRQLVVIYHRRIAPLIDNKVAAATIGLDYHVPATNFGIAGKRDIYRFGFGAATDDDLVLIDRDHVLPDSAAPYFEPV